jgi:hypothetical protein
MIYLRSISAENNSPEDMHKIMEQYQKDRTEVFRVFEEIIPRIKLLQKKIKRKEDEKMKAGRGDRKLEAKEQKLKEKAEKQKRLKKMEKQKEAQYIKEERLRYWPKKVYRILLQLETTVLSTPSSSRRGSIDSVTLAQSPVLSPSKGGDLAEGKAVTSEIFVCLSLSYVTREAEWTPRYDIKVSSIDKSAVIAYRTEFINHTSETWRDAKISFSTSQTSYQGLDDMVPQMQPWHARLNQGGHSDESGLLSLQETEQPRRGRQFLPQFARHQYFGQDSVYIEPKQIGSFKGRANVLPYNAQQMPQLTRSAGQALAAQPSPPRRPVLGLSEVTT